MDTEALKEEVIRAIRTVFDPEIPVNVYDLGLIYDVAVGEEGQVDITMTLTTPACPEAQVIPPTIEQEVRLVEGVTDVSVELVWDPPWGPERMSEGARLALGFDL